MNSLYLCRNQNCSEQFLKADTRGFSCKCGEFYGFYGETEMPVFSQACKDSSEYNIDNALERYANQLNWLFATFYTSAENVRRDLVAKMHIKAGDKILITSAGSGDDIPFIAEALNFEGEIHIQDFSLFMLLGAMKTYQYLHSDKLKLVFSISDAMDLPYADNYFDGLYHFGCLSSFSDIKKGIYEAYRVCKEDRPILLCDTGMAPWLEKSSYAKMLIDNNHLYECGVPLQLLPENIKDVNVSWILGDTTYLILFKKHYK